MHVELVIAELERDPVVAVVLDLHSEHAGIEIEAAVEIARSQHDVVERPDHLPFNFTISSITCCEFLEVSADR